MAQLTDQEFEAKWNLGFADNTMQDITEKTFRVFKTDLKDSYANMRALNVRQVRGATYPLPYTDSVSQIPPAYRIVGMLALARVGTTAADAATQPTLAGPVTLQLVAAADGDVDALVDEQPATTTTVKAKWVPAPTSNLLDTNNTWAAPNYFAKGVQFKNATGFDEFGQLFIYSASFGNKHAWRDNVYSLASDSLIAWRAAEYTTSGTNDVGLARSGAGVLEVNTGTKGSSATLTAMDVVAQAAPPELNALTKLATAVGRLLGLVPAGATRLVDTNDTRLQDLARGFIDYQNEIELYEEDVTNNANSVVFAAIPLQTGRAFRLNRHAASSIAAAVVLPSPGYSNSYVLSFRIGPGIISISSLTIKDNAGRVLIVLTAGQTAVVRGQYGGWSVLLSSGQTGSAGASTFDQLGGAPRDNAALAAELDAVQSLSDGRRDLVSFANNRFTDVVLERRVTLSSLLLATNASAVAGQVLANGTAAVSAPRTGSPAAVLAALQADINGLSSYAYYLIRVQTTPAISTDVAHVLLTITA